MAVSRSGYYKWLKRPASSRSIKRVELIQLVEMLHKDHPSHGYRWMAAFIRLNYEYDCSDNFVFKCFHYLGIQSETRHKIHYKPRKDKKNTYPNLIFTTWETVDRPRQVIVSDMTAFTIYYTYLELTLYFDVFTKQIISYRFGTRRGDRMQYIDGLEDVISILKKEGCDDPVILHTDQGTVYSSIAYNDLIKDTNITHSMSRPGTPTDNPVNESLNGWIKEELYLDFHLGSAFHREQMMSIIKAYISYYNSMRPSYALGYDIPNHYYERFLNGEIKSRDTFEDRVLTTEPKFVQKRRAKSHSNSLDQQVSDMDENE